ncbi:hypothetical protein MHU86_13854 [Fragilaria crotonensis]|nr:hypothetical protein MHU86_13854 [Fragilaria crotonensis]
MSTNLHSTENRTSSLVSDQGNKKRSLTMNDMFVKELIVERDFKVNNSGDIVMIRHLPVSKCTVPLLRQICVHFKVTGYKNQNKESTLGLLKNLVVRETLKNKMYNKEDDDSDSYFSVSSKEGTPPPPEPYRRNLSEASAKKKDMTDSQNGSDSSTHQDTEPATEEYRVAVVEGEGVLRLDEEDDDHGSINADDDINTTNKETGLASVTKRRKKKKFKGTAPDAVTCINTYFRVINVYMCQKNRSLVMDLGRPPTKADLDSRTSPHRHVYEALLSQYLDENNDDAATFAFPDHVFWTLTGIRCDIASSEFDSALTSNDIEAILAYINHHYQIAFRRNKQSGSHSDFENFVGTRYFLFYYHLWLSEAPNLLNFAVADLPSNAFRESYHVSRASDDDKGVGTNISDASHSADRKKARRKKDPITTKAVGEDKNIAQKQLADALVAFNQAQSEKAKSNRESAAPRRERDLLEVFSEYKGRLKATRLELNAAKNEATYDSDNSDVVNLKREITLCKRKRDEIFGLLSESDLT